MLYPNYFAEHKIMFLILKFLEIKIVKSQISIQSKMHLTISKKQLGSQHRKVDFRSSLKAALKAAQVQ